MSEPDSESTVTSEDWAFICPPGGRRRELYDLRRDPAQAPERRRAKVDGRRIGLVDVLGAARHEPEGRPDGLSGPSQRPYDLQNVVS